MVIVLLLMQLLNLLRGCHHLEAVLLSAGMNHLMKGRHLLVGSCLCELFVPHTNLGSINEGRMSYQNLVKLCPLSLRNWGC